MGSTSLSRGGQRGPDLNWKHTLGRFSSLRFSQEKSEIQPFTWSSHSVHALLWLGDSQELKPHRHLFSSLATQLHCRLHQSLDHFLHPWGCHAISTRTLGAASRPPIHTSFSFLSLHGFIRASSLPGTFLFSLLATCTPNARQSLL